MPSSLWVVSVGAAAVLLGALFHASSPAASTQGVPAAIAVPKGKQPLGINWQIVPRTGWGTFGAHLVASLHGNASAPYQPLVTIEQQQPELLPSGALTDLEALLAVQRQEQDKLGGGGARQKLAGAAGSSIAAAVAFPVLHSISGAFLAKASGRAKGAWSDTKNVAFCFFENTDFSEVQRAHAARFDLVLAGSHWNREVLRRVLKVGEDRDGARSKVAVETAWQGVDTALFRPASPGGTEGGAASAMSDATRRALDELGGSGGKFVVFSGGKLEMRKAQDIVTLAFARFGASHPDAVLLTAWHNTWPKLVGSIAAAGLVNGAPDVARLGQVRPLWLQLLFGARYAFPVPRMFCFSRTPVYCVSVVWVGMRIQVRGVEEWLEEHGVHAAQRRVMPELAQPDIAALLRRADVAVFPNRAEGGTNLVAMEAMAAGVPVIISNNTGHADIVGGGEGARGEGGAHCYALPHRPLPQKSWAKFTQGWGEPSVDSVVAALEEVYADRAAAQERGERAAAFIREHFTWQHSIARISALLRKHGI